MITSPISIYDRKPEHLYLLVKVIQSEPSLEVWIQIVTNLLCLTKLHPFFRAFIELTKETDWV